MKEWFAAELAPGLEEEGIFRKSGNADDIEKLVRQFSKRMESSALDLVVLASLVSRLSSRVSRLSSLLVSQCEFIA